MSERSSRSRPRSWLRRLIIGLLVVANIVVFGAYFFLRNIESAFKDSVAVNQEVSGELDQAPSDSSQPSTFLVIGSDSRENIPGEFEDHFGVAPGERADVIMLVRVSPDEATARLLSIPRDLKVTLPGRGTQKINAAYAFGGGAQLVSTVREVTGLPVHHYVEVDFAGFAGIVDELGGVVIDFPYPARDAKSGLDVESGPQRLNGEAAVAYARSRSYEELRNGVWVSSDASDIGRMARQQALVFALISQMQRPSTITQAEELVVALGSHLEVDAALVDRGVLELAWAMRNIRPSGITAATYPTSTQVIDGIYYEIPVEPDAATVLREFEFSAEPVTVYRPGDVRLEVLNGNGSAGIAGRFADAFEADGFLVGNVADAGSFNYRSTQIIVDPAVVGKADLVVDSLGFGTVVPGELPDGIDVRVILGGDAS